jgi:hypothetical protein
MIGIQNSSMYSTGISQDQAGKIPYGGSEKFRLRNPCLDEVRRVDGEKDELGEGEGENEDGGRPPLVLFSKGRGL